MAKATHLIGAHGMFWERDAINWQAPRGQTFQMLGFRNPNRGVWQVCDFRRARGIYVLFNDFGPTYVGRARGNEGFGSRLKMHDSDDTKRWKRFCWFSFDTIAPVRGEQYWHEALRDEGNRAITADSAIDELEALMITAFGLTGTQNEMKLQTARQPWKQLTMDDCFPGEPGHKFDSPRIRMKDLRWAFDYPIDD